jgi:predicted ArsR family transcriptional regulator
VDDTDLRTLATLGDDIRRALFEFVRAAPHPVTRDEAAAAVGISRKLAAFHLDKLVAAGLLSARIDAPSPRRVGRAPKVYSRGNCAISVSVPPRESELLASVLVDAIEAAPATAHRAALEAARIRGRELGGAERARRGRGRTSRARHRVSVGAVLTRCGFEPVSADAVTRLRNCPFHPIAAGSPQLVCGMNRELIAGVVEGLGADEYLEAVLAPEPGWCCVEVRDRE